MKTYNKLVRNKIPEIIKANGNTCKFHVAKKDEFKILIWAKLKEEVNELMQKPCAEEIADVLEVIEAIAIIEGISLDEIKLAKKTKKLGRGDFNKRIVLETTDDQ